MLSVSFALIGEGVGDCVGLLDGDAVGSVLVGANVGAIESHSNETRIGLVALDEYALSMKTFTELDAELI